MIEYLLVLYIYAPRKLTEEQLKLIKELAGTRKNVFQQSLGALDEILFMFGQSIASLVEGPEWTLWQEQRKTQEFREKKQKIINLKNKCFEAKIPEEMVKTLILDYDDLLKFERSSFLFLRLTRLNMIISISIV